MNSQVSLIVVRHGRAAVVAGVPGGDPRLGRRRPGPGHDCRLAGCRPHVCHPMKPSTIRGIHSILSGAFAAAQRREWTDRNPAESARPPTTTRQPIPATSPEDMAKVVAQARARSADLGLYLWLVVVTGVRRGELCGLQIRDIDLDRGLVHVAFSYVVRGARHQGRAALHRQPVPRRRFRLAQHRRAARPPRGRRDHAAALRRPGPRSGQARRRIPRTADRQIYSVISSALTWPYATTGRSATWPGRPDRRISAGSKPERGDLCACPRVRPREPAAGIQA